MDYDGKGNFADNYNGVTGNNLASEWPDVSKSRAGLPVFSVDFGENAHFWILDSPTYKLDSKDAVCYAWFMQGTNILGSDETGIPGTDAERSSIYSTRAVVLGGALIRTNDGHTTDNLNRELDGFADMGVGSNVNYVEATTRFSQLIYNTDIILKAPSSGTAASEIRRPQTWRDRTYHTSYITDKDKTFAPTMTIKGGTIYVGNRQELTIQGTVTGVRSGTDPTVVPLDNMWISPDRIIVATGGALIIRESKTTNVITDIYVDGGTLTIKAGAKIKGNIYAYNGGTVKLEGAFQLDFPDEFGRAHDGLLIYGNDTVGAKIRTGAGENDFVEITEAGQLETPAVLAAITGTSSRVHLVGGDWATLVPKTPVDALKGAYAENFLCEGYNKQTGRCPHYDGRPAGSEGWVVGIYDDS
jgi:hypothetical protein